MARIKCRTPSTGKTLSISVNDVSTSFTTIAEAPDFSVPDAAGNFPVRDPADSTRTIKPGEIFFLTPMSVTNKSANTAWLEVQLNTENNTPINLGKIFVPAGDTVFVPIQGRSLLKRDANTSNGDIIQIRSEVSNTFDIWLSAEEKLSSEHIGVE